MNKRFAAPIAILIALATVPVLSACSVESIIEQATGGAVQVSGTSLPEGFPTEVPVVEGEIQFGGFVQDGENKVYNVTVKVAGDSPVAGITSALEGAGFTSQVGGVGETADGATLVYASDAWGVLVVVAKDGGNWITNYTVTSAQAG